MINLNNALYLYLLQYSINNAVKPYKIIKKPPLPLNQYYNNLSCKAKSAQQLFREEWLIHKVNNGTAFKSELVMALAIKFIKRYIPFNYLKNAPVWIPGTYLSHIIKSQQASIKVLGLGMGTNKRKVGKDMNCENRYLSGVVGEDMNLENRYLSGVVGEDMNLENLYSYAIQRSEHFKTLQGAIKCGVVIGLGMTLWYGIIHTDVLLRPDLCLDRSFALATKVVNEQGLVGLERLEWSPEQHPKEVYVEAIEQVKMLVNHKSQASELLSEDLVDKALDHVRTKSLTTIVVGSILMVALLTHSPVSDLSLEM